MHLEQSPRPVSRIDRVLDAAFFAIVGTAGGAEVGGSLFHHNAIAIAIGGLAGAATGVTLAVRRTRG